MEAGNAVPVARVSRRPPLASLAEDQVIKRHGFRANQTFEPLPSPTGAFPYRLVLDAVVGSDGVAAIRKFGKLVLHMMGDTGGVKSPQPQQIVAATMEKDFTAAAGDRPEFLYLLGDVIYYNGERSQYYPQLYEPSLAAFVDNFCITVPRLAAEAQETHWDTLVQPLVFWTLRAPFVTIIGLYSNVPEGGRLDDHEIAWLQAELAAAPRDAFLLVTVPHPLYSAYAHHGGSAHLGGVLDSAFQKAGRTPEAVFTGHVHNYQRFTRLVNGRPVPYVVAGAGGYWHLHPMARDQEGNRLPRPWQVPNSDVTLEKYVDDRHGYLRLIASATTLNGEYITVPRPQESWQSGPVTIATIADSFSINL